MMCPARPLSLAEELERRSLWEDKLRLTVLAIGAVTVVSGGAQVAAPRFVLGMIGADRSATSAQLFATVGAFMVVVGGALAQVTLRGSEVEVVLFWSAVQKVMAVTAVGLGVAAGVFGPAALAVAAFDLISAGLITAYALRARRLGSGGDPAGPGGGRAGAGGDWTGRGGGWAGRFGRVARRPAGSEAAGLQMAVVLP